MSSIEDEWNNFIMNQHKGVSTSFIKTEQNINEMDNSQIESVEADRPVCEDLYISTKTKVLFLNQAIDIQNIFWNIWNYISINYGSINIKINIHI